MLLDPRPGVTIDLETKLSLEKTNHEIRVMMKFRGEEVPRFTRQRVADMLYRHLECKFVLYQKPDDTEITAHLLGMGFDHTFGYNPSNTFIGAGIFRHGRLEWGSVRFEDDYKYRCEPKDPEFAKSLLNELREKIRGWIAEVVSADTSIPEV